MKCLTTYKWTWIYIYKYTKYSHQSKFIYTEGKPHQLSILQVKYIFQTIKLQSVALMLYKHYFWALNDQKLFLSSPAYFQDAQQQPSAALCPVLFRNGINSRVRNLPLFPHLPRLSGRMQALAYQNAPSTVTDWQAVCLLPPISGDQGDMTSVTTKVPHTKTAARLNDKLKLARMKAQFTQQWKSRRFFLRWKGINKWLKLRLTEDVADEEEACREGCQSFRQNHIM